MRYRLRTLLILLAVGPPLLAIGCGKSRVPRVLPEAQAAALDNGHSFELLSLKPMERSLQAEDSFHKWTVLGKTSIDDDTRKALVVALKKGVAEGGPVAGCFMPRHGIRVEHEGHIHDFVICFECLWGEAYVDGVGVNGAITVSRSPQATFDDALCAARVPLPMPPKKREDARPMLRFTIRDVLVMAAVAAMVGMVLACSGYVTYVERLKLTPIPVPTPPGI